jgi:hypothetical protein
MKKSTRFLKKLMALFLVVLMSIKSFAAIVSDNDGSAFVTKAEFEAMKNGFAEQITNYNESIDSKIDGAIAAYLAGLQLSKASNLTNYVSSMYEQYVYANAFAEKSVPLTGSNNNNFVRGAWWLFFVWGWNLGDGNGNGQINISNAYLTDHQMHIAPGSTNSKKYFVKSIEYDGVKYYSPYDQYTYYMDQVVTAQKVTSVFNRHNIPTAPPTLSDLSFDYRSLSASGTVNLGNYNMGEWGSHSGIEGTIILNYNKDAIDRRWGCLNAIGACDNSGLSFAVDFDKRWDLTEEVNHTGEKFKGSDSWGAQPQSFKPSDMSYGWQGSLIGVPNVTFYYNIPKVLSTTNAELCNYIASKTIDKYVPMYGGLPITTLPGNGKVKFKYRCATKNILSNANTADNVKVIFKTKQFGNNPLSSETDKVYETTRSNSDWTTCEFEISDAKKDGSTVLYVKVAPSNTENYVRFEIDGSITFIE